MAAALNSNFSVRQTTPAVLRELSGCLALLEQYIAASPVPSLPGLVLATCGESLQGIRMLLHIGGAVSSWPEETMDLIGALLGLYTTLQSNCRQPATGQQLLSLLVEDRDFVTMTSDFAKHVLATPTLHPTPHGPHTGASAAQTGTIGSPGTASSSPVPISPFANLTLPLNGDSPRDNHRHQLVTLRFYAALAGLVGRQPSVEALQQPDAGRQAPASKDPGNDTLLPGPPGDLGQRVNGSGPHAGTWTAADKALKRKAALRHFHFLVDPSRGAAVRLLEQKPAAARDKEGCVHTEVLHMLRAVFSVPGNPFLDVKRISDHYIHIHFLHFAKLYHTQGRREAPTPPLCLAHLGVLRAIAGCKGADVRRRFYQLRIMDFLVRELSLECEAAQWASLPAGMGGSGPLSRSPSSALHTPSGLGPPVNEPLSPYTPSFAKPPAAKLALPGQLLTSRSRAQSGDDLSARSGKSGSGSAKSGGSSRRSRVPPLTLSRSASLADATAEAANEPEYRDGTGTVRTSDGDLDEDCEALEALEAEQEAAGMSSDDEGSDSGSDASEDSPRLNDSANGTKWSSPPRRAVPCLRLGAARKDSGLSPGPFIKAQAGALDTTPSKVAELVAKFEAASSPMADSPAVKLTPFKAPGSPVADSPGRKIAAYMPAGSPLAPALPERAAPATAGKGPAFIPRLNLSASLHSNMEQRLQTAEASVAAEAVSKDSAKPNLTLLEGFAMDKGRMQAALMARQPSRVVESASEVLAEGGLPPRLSCHEERAQRPLYRNTELHLLVLETVLEVVLTREGELDPVYCCQLPLERRMQNVLYLLQQHLNHAANAALIAPLLTRAVAIGPAAERLLRLLCRGLFQSHLYSARSRLARGAYAQVFRCPLPTQAGGPDHVALKVVDLPTSLHDPCYQVDMFSEVAILERFRGQASICQLYDYGIDADSFVLVLRCYRCSLKEWRTRQPPGPGPQLRLYLALFAQVLAAVQVLGLANVVHFDLKCDNILLEALPGCSEEDFWSPPSADALPFRVVLADFGESRMFTSADNSVTARNRGTECVKSPEMLLVANADKKGRDTYDRRKKEGAGAASDVWSVGCLLFELITGDFLFYDPDWIRFFMRLTQPGQVLLAPERAAAVAQLPGVPELLDCILVRDPRRRPPLAEVAHRVQNLLAGTRIRLPPYLRPQAPAPDHLDAAHSALSPLQRFGQNGLVATASPDAPYCTAEYYLSVLTPVSDRLLLGSLAGLQPPAALAEAGVGHVLLLCARSELRGESGGGEQGQAAAAALCSWAVADSSLNTALANCAAAEASCRLVPLANLPDIEPAEGPSDSLDLVRILPSLLQHMSSVTGPAAASAGSLSRSPRGRRVLIAAAPGYEGEAAVVAMAQLMVKSNLSAYEALLLVSQRQIALQSGSPAQASRRPLHIIANWMAPGSL
ncbi:hypothetical protein WJX72_010021 [[Myrmecia] bisecta]|uniref:non-specific serine/threonine protein kinase n=1 Tax=[Myrmecia] bisecta TaxID=41462 RepID=A0AAW1PP64_9CHLO